MTKVVIDGKIRLERVRVMPVRINGRVKVHAAKRWGKHVLRRRRGRKRECRTGRPVSIRESLEVILQSLGDRIEEGPGGRYVVVPGAAADNRLSVAEGLVGEPESRLKAQGGRMAQSRGQPRLHVPHDWGARDAIFRSIGGVGIVDASGAASVHVGQLFHVQCRGVAGWINQSPGSRDRRIKVPGQPVGRSKRGMVLVAQAKGEVQTRCRLPVVLRIERVRPGGPYIVLPDVIAQGLVRHADQEICELIAGRGVNRIEVKIPIVNRRCRSTRFRVSPECPHVGSKPNRMRADLPCHVVDILEDARLLLVSKPLPDAVDIAIVKLHVRKAVEEGRRLEDVQVRARREGFAIKGIAVSIFLKREAVTEFVRDVRRENVVEAARQDAVPRVRGTIRQRQICRNHLIDILEGEAAGDHGFLSEVLVATDVELVRADVITPGTQVVVSRRGDGLLQRLVGKLRRRVRVEAQEGRRARIDRHCVVGVRRAGKWIDQGRLGLLGEVTLLHQRRRNLGLQNV